MTAIESRLLFQSGLLVLSLLPALSWAQHPPLTGTMGTPSDAPSARQEYAPTAPAMAPVASVTPVAPLRPAPIAFGDGTRSLLRLQAEGSQGGRALPMLGETASRSYQRYLGSFEHPIPEFFEATLPTNKGQGSTP